MTTSTLSTVQRFKYVGIIIVLAGIAIAFQLWYQGRYVAAPVTLTLLIPDDARLDDPSLTLWLDAAREEGILLQPLRDSDFLHPWFDRNRLGGIVLADQIHRVASDVLIDTLAQYTAEGGRLMLVYDAGIWNRSQRYAEPYSRLSHLAGIEYGHYARLKERVSGWTPVLGSAATFDALQVPAGKFALYEDMREYTKSPALTRKLIDDPLYTLAGYDLPVLSYDVFATQGEYAGKVLLQSPDGSVAAGINVYGQGEVLFVNLPLGYLKERTDGLLTHGFLRYFAEHTLQLPRLASVPDGVGGLVMNWHLDSNVTLPALEGLAGLGFFEHGPFSVHITAGPDAQYKGDHAGINVAGNRKMQAWINTFRQHNYQVGSHGGWIHDYWGEHAPDQPAAEFVEFLELNKQALEAVTGVPLLEYSAPEGNHPLWVNDWLNDNGFVAYYSAGNSGMAPTRSYRGGRLRYPGLWSFPIVTYRDMAGFEELRDSGVSNKLVSEWLHAISDFTVRHRSARLIYFHPRGALLYPAAMREWLAYTKHLKQEAHFNWYTLAGLSEFLTRRLETQWQASQSGDSHVFTAYNANGLAGHCWMLPKTAYQQPEILLGKVTVGEDDKHWLIKAENGNDVQFRAERVTTE